jgi:lipopolysaccharide/colanic/teichoic acid biosynthesis glycosyltransferase
MHPTADHLRPHRINVRSKIDPFYVRPFPLWKRAFDIFGAVVGLILLSPILVAIGVFIRRVSPGPVLFRQTRIGKGGKPFEFLKFRTMHPNVDTTVHREYLAELIGGGETAENGQPMIKLEDEHRLIPYGQLLRSSCLDELPQLVNVLKGEMSLVGPRPPIPYETAVYYCWHNGRFDCRPGMTGLWQVSGKNNLSFKEMVRLDIQYARNCSIWQDIKILLKTPYTIFMQVCQGIRHTQSEDEGVEQCTR